MTTLQVNLGCPPGGSHLRLTNPKFPLIKKIPVAAYPGPERFNLSTMVGIYEVGFILLFLVSVYKVPF